MKIARSDFKERCGGASLPSTLPTDGKHGTVTLNDLGITLKMRGQAKSWQAPTTLTVVYKPSRRQWFASFTYNGSCNRIKLNSSGINIF